MAGSVDNDTPPSTPKGAEGGASSLSQRENEIMAKAMMCLKSPPEIDYQKLATEVGMKNPRSAANVWGAIKKKMGWDFKNTPASAKSSGGPKRKKTATSTANEGSDEEIDSTPVKKTKRSTIASPTAQKKAAPKKVKSPAVAKDESEEEADKKNDILKDEEAV